MVLRPHNDLVQINPWLLLETKCLTGIGYVLSAFTGIATTIATTTPTILAMGFAGFLLKPIRYDEPIQVKN